MYLMKLA